MLSPLHIKPKPQSYQASGLFYFYAAEDILFETDAVGAVGNRYTHGPGVDEPLALSNNKGTFYYHSDGLGSIVALTNTAEEVVQDYQYYFFGDLKDEKNRIKQPYRYTAREWDGEIGLYFYRARYYDADAGRFTTKDPIGFRGGINLYNYVGANPINWSDPFGLRQNYAVELTDGTIVIAKENNYEIYIDGELVSEPGRPKMYDFWQDDPAVQLDATALASDLTGNFTLGIAASIGSIAYTAEQYYYEDNASFIDLSVSLATTILGVHPVLVYPADGVILLYDICSAELRGQKQQYSK